MDYQLAADEKSTLIMIYTANMLVRGEFVTKKTMRVNIWPRGQGVPNLMRIHNPSILLFTGTPPKNISQSEIYIPTTGLIGFHTALPNDEPLDYDPAEMNRTTTPISVIMGSFIVKGNIRIASSASLATSLEVMFNGWLSIYDAEITNPSLSQIQPLQVKFLLVKPNSVNFMI